jgi:hypothetical protein
MRQSNKLSRKGTNFLAILQTTTPKICNLAYLLTLFSAFHVNRRWYFAKKFVILQNISAIIINDSRNLSQNLRLFKFYHC